MAFQPVSTFAAYVATKASVLAFGEALHDEVGSRGVAVTLSGPHRDGIDAAAGATSAALTAHCTKRRKTMLALTPPKPKPFEIACSIAIGRAFPPTISSPSAAASTFSKLRVGGAI